MSPKGDDRASLKVTLIGWDIVVNLETLQGKGILKLKFYKTHFYYYYFLF